MKKIRCYNVTEVLNMRGIKDKDIELLADKFIQYNVHIFQPSTTPGSGRGRRERSYYVTTNEDFDRWVSLNNTIAVLKNFPIAKLKYKKYPQDVAVDMFDYIK